MPMQSINPANGEVLLSEEYWSDSELESVLESCSQVKSDWQNTPLAQRCDLLRATAKILRKEKESLAEVISLEMGKLITESKAEVEKCAQGCEYYANHAGEFLQNEIIKSDASNSYVAYQPLGTVLAVMPWNFPLWQVFRFAAPSLVAGNTALLKHASNVPQCAKKIEEVFLEAGFPENVFKALMIPASKVADVIADHRVQAVTITGSEPAGRSVAENAGKYLKPSVLELGGSDPFIVLADADMDEAVKWGVISRFMNSGQSCIAAKRFILVADAADQFLDKFVAEIRSLKMGDPMLQSTQLAPMARVDLRDELHSQVQQAIEQGALPLCGCEPGTDQSAFYQASVIDQVKPGNIAYEEELFGPVAIIIRAEDVGQAVEIANCTRFGLGGSVWTQNLELGERIALQLDCGAAFVNGLVKSDPRLPFGGVKSSGYGRELCHHGIREFVNAKTVWIK